jgi:hypothetical protein
VKIFSRAFELLWLITLMANFGSGSSIAVASISPGVILLAYDGQSHARIGCDGRYLPSFRYDSTAVPTLAKEANTTARASSVFGISAEFLAADTGANIALGSRYSGLRTFASDIGADHLLDVPNNQWKDVFLSHVDNPSTTFHVNMGGFFGDTPSEMILNEMQSGSHTGWELQQLQQAGRLPQVNFYQPGNLTPIPNPFIK